MKKNFTVFLLFLSVHLFAQDAQQQTSDPNERAKIAQSVEALKIAFMTKELNLNTDEAQKFWPVYNNYTADIKKARLENKQDDIAFEEKKVALMKKYKEDFKKVLNNEDRVRKCFRAEPEFHNLLRKEWARRQMNRPLQHPNQLPGANRSQQFQSQQHPGRPGSRGPRG